MDDHSPGFQPFSGTGHRLADGMDTPAGSQAYFEQLSEEPSRISQSQPIPQESGREVIIPDDDENEEEEENEPAQPKPVLVSEMSDKLSQYAQVASSWIDQCPSCSAAEFIPWANQLVEAMVCLISFLPVAPPEVSADDRELSLFDKAKVDFAELRERWGKAKAAERRHTGWAELAGEPEVDSQQVHGDESCTTETEPQSMFQGGSYQDIKHAIGNRIQTTNLRTKM